MENELYICSSVNECDLERCQAQKPHKCSLGHLWYCGEIKKTVQCIPCKEPRSDIELAFDELLEDIC
jgi:hypothetical protein